MIRKDPGSDLKIIAKIKNPFNNAPVYYTDSVNSTMNLAENYCSSSQSLPGMVFMTGLQTAGRGRIAGRVWEGEKNKNLLFTLVLSMEELGLQALPIKIGLGIAIYLEKYHKLKPFVKWPNDIYINDRKIAGIIIESRKGLYNIGIGININQTEFPEIIETSATSLAIEKNNYFNLYSELEHVLFHLKKVLSLGSWENDISARLYNSGKKVVLSTGIPGKEKKIEGTIEGIGVSGQLLLRSNGRLLEIYSGEVSLYGE